MNRVLRTILWQVVALGFLAGCAMSAGVFKVPWVATVFDVVLVLVGVLIPLTAFVMLVWRGAASWYVYLVQGIPGFLVGALLVYLVRTSPTVIVGGVSSFTGRLLAGDTFKFLYDRVLGSPPSRAVQAAAEILPVLLCVLLPVLYWWLKDSEAGRSFLVLNGNVFALFIIFIASVTGATFYDASGLPWLVESNSWFEDRSPDLSHEKYFIEAHETLDTDPFIVELAVYNKFDDSLLVDGFEAECVDPAGKTLHVFSRIQEGRVSPDETELIKILLDPPANTSFPLICKASLSSSQFDLGERYVRQIGVRQDGVMT